jgi:hypothetical protein
VNTTVTPEMLMVRGSIPAGSGDHVILGRFRTAFSERPIEILAAQAVCLLDTRDPAGA